MKVSCEIPGTGPNADVQDMDAIPKNNFWLVMPS